MGNTTGAYGAGNTTFPAPSGGVLTNAVASEGASSADSEPTRIPSSICQGPLPERNNGESTDEYLERLLTALPGCTTTHTVAETFFQIRKHEVAGGVVLPAGEGTELMISDTYPNAQDELPSKWLCYKSYNPCGPNGVVENWETGGENTQPSEPECKGGGIAGSLDVGYKAPGTATCDGADCLGGWDFSSEDSATYLNINHWHKAAEVYNTFYADEITAGTITKVNTYRSCGLIYGHTESSTKPNAEPGTWHVQDLKGREHVEWPINANDTGTVETTGTYWLVETKAAPGVQLFAQPQQFWVAPNTFTPATGVPPSKTGDNDFYGYQGRVSLSTVGVGEMTSGGQVIRNRCDAWCEDPSPEQPPTDD